MRRLVPLAAAVAAVVAIPAALAAGKVTFENTIPAHVELTVRW